MGRSPSPRRPATDNRSLAARRRQQTLAVSLLAFGASWALVASHPAATTSAASPTSQPLTGSRSLPQQPASTPTPTFFNPQPGTGGQTSPNLRPTNRRGTLRSGGS
jgi:hypothetical protein